MAAPVLVSKGTASFVNGAGDVTPSYPASLAAGDIVFLLALTASGGGAGYVLGSILVPSGFTYAAAGTYRTSGGVSRGRANLFWKRAAGGESGTVTIVWSSSNKGVNPALGAQMYRVTGCPSSGVPWESLLVAGEDLAGVGSATITWPAIQVGGTERTLLAFLGQADDLPGAATPTDYAATLAPDTVDGASDEQLVVFDKSNTSSDGSITAANGEANGWLGFHLSLHAVAQSLWNILETSRVLSSSVVETAGTTATLSPTQTLPVGKLLIVRCVSDNISTASGQTTDHTLADNVGGHTYTKLREHTRSSGAAGDGVTVSIWALKIVNAIAPSAVLTLTISGSVVVKGLAVELFDLPAGRTFQLLGTAAAVGVGTTPSVTLSGLADVEHLFLGVIGNERPLSDGFSNACPDFAGNTGFGGTLTGTSSVRCDFGFRVWKATSATYNPTPSSSGDWVVVLVALDSVTPSAVELNIDVASMTLTGKTFSLDRKLHLAVASLPMAGQAAIPQAQIFFGAASMQAVGKGLSTAVPINVTRNLDLALAAWVLNVIPADLEDFIAADMECAGQAVLIEPQLPITRALFEAVGKTVTILNAAGGVVVINAASMPIQGQTLAPRTVVNIGVGSIPLTGQLLNIVDIITVRPTGRWRWNKIRI